MNILFVNVNWNLFDRMDCGASNRSTMFIRALAGLGHVDIISFGAGEQISNIPDCDVIYTTDGSETEAGERSIVPKFIRNIFHGINNWLQLFFCPTSPATYYEYYPQRADIVKACYEKKHYDLVACRYIDVAWSCGLMPYMDKLVIDVDDNLRHATLRDLEHKKHRKLFSKWRMLLRARQIEKMSQSFLSRVHTSFYYCITEQPYDKSVFLHNVNATRYKIPNVTASTPKHLLMVGWLDFGPNREGASRVTEQVFPLVRKEVTDAELHIIGKSKDAAFLEHLNSLPGVSALGFVENLSEEYENSRVLLVPVYQGAGTSVKFVEGLMTNRPIVSTPMGARGFEYLCKPGVHYLSADSDEAFAANVIRLLKSVELSNELSHNAYEIGIANFSQDRFYAIVRETVSVNSVQLTINS